MNRCEKIIEKFEKLESNDALRAKFKKANPKMSDEDIDKMIKNIKEGKDNAGVRDGTGPVGGKEGKGKNKDKETCKKDKESNEAKGKEITLKISDSTMNLINQDKKKELKSILDRLIKDIKSEVTIASI